MIDNMNIFLHELRAYRKSIIIWSLSMAALIVMFLSIFPDFSKYSTDAQRVLQGYPESLRRALGISLANIFTLMGFYSYVFLYVVLCCAIQATNYGLLIGSKEIRQKTADFLLTKPVTRPTIITSKLFAALTAIAITNVVYLITAILMASAVTDKPFSMGIFIMVSITLFFVQLMFFALGVLISVIFPKIRSVISISLGVVFGLFIINMFESILGEKALRYLTPFKYYDIPYIIKNGAYETTFVVLEFLFIAAAIAASYYIYSKKDIHAV